MIEGDEPTRKWGGSLLKTSALALVSVLFATGGQLLLKAGMEKVGYLGASQLAKPVRLAAEIARTPFIWLGLFVFGVSALVWLVVLSRAPLSFAYPFAGLTFMFVTLIGKFVLHEQIPALRWLGISMIVAGIVLVARTAPPGID